MRINSDISVTLFTPGFETETSRILSRALATTLLRTPDIAPLFIAKKETENIFSLKKPTTQSSRQPEIVQNGINLSIQSLSTIIKIQF